MKTQTYPQRSEYMNGTVTHDEWYGSIADCAGIRFSGPFLERIRNATRKGDKHLNSIPLREWDRRGADMGLRTRMNTAIKLHGDFLSMAGIVCILKAAAKKSAQEAP